MAAIDEAPKKGEIRPHEGHRQKQSEEILGPTRLR